MMCTLVCLTYEKNEVLKRIFGFLYFSLPLFSSFLFIILFKNNIFRTRARTRTSKRNKGEKEGKQGNREIEKKGKIREDRRRRDGNNEDEVD